jgi:hypothetical protein
MTSTKRRVALRARWALLFAFSACGAFQGNVKHPEPGMKNSAAYCAEGSSQEHNCSYCASKPGCGYCATATDPAAFCQPGVIGDLSPSTCTTPLIVDTNSCPAPPPPL